MDGSDVVLNGGRGGSAGQTAQAAHGFSGTRQNASVRTIPKAYLGNVGLMILSIETPNSQFTGRQCADAAFAMG